MKAKEIAPKSLGEKVIDYMTLVCKGDPCTVQELFNHLCVKKQVDKQRHSNDQLTQTLSNFIAENKILDIQDGYLALPGYRRHNESGVSYYLEDHACI